MRRSGVFAFLALASGVAAVACSLVVDTNGLSGAEAGADGGGDAGTTPESGTTDGPATDSPATDGTAPGGGFDCDGGTRLTSFETFTPNGAVTISGSTITATGSTTAVGQQIAAVARGDFNTVPRRLLVAYDLVLTRSDVVYIEPGCGVYLQNNAQTILRQTFAANHSEFSSYLDVDLPDGGQTSQFTDFAELPSGESTRHVEVLLTTSGTTVTANVTVAGLLRSDPLVLLDTPSAFFVRCGISYGEQQSPGSETTTVTVKNLEISLCP